MRENGLRGSRVLRVLLMVCMLAWGCASMKTTCSYYEDGTLRDYKLRSTVLGTGETEVVSTDCAVIAYSTQGTGLSDNGTLAVGALVPFP